MMNSSSSSSSQRSPCSIHIIYVLVVLLALGLIHDVHSYEATTLHARNSKVIIRSNNARPNVNGWNRKHDTHSTGEYSSVLASSSNRDSTSLRLNPDPNVITAEQKQSSLKKDTQNTLKWFGAAGVFAAGLTATMGTQAGIEFCSGYVLEQCLSVDNLFVFLVLFDYFGVNKVQQERVLSYGIWGAIVLRGIFVFTGSVALAQFHQILLVFAAVLFVSSYKILFSGGGEDDEEEDVSQNAVVKFAKSYFKTTDEFDGNKFFTEVVTADGVQKLATPLFLCLVCIELSDVVFAFDSVPAIFGVTENPLIVYSSNIFAIAGLRAVFGVLSEAVSQLEYLEKAVGIVLAVIATKMTFETFDINILTPLQSLVVVIGILAGGVGLSLNKKKATTEADTEPQLPR